MIAALHSTDYFIALESDERILYEPGAKGLAEIVSTFLSQAIATVEEQHHRSFAKPIVVYVCLTEDEFSKFTGVSKHVRATQFREKVFLSPLAFKQGAEGPLLTHELSHLHLFQQLSIFWFFYNIPAWFSEGLATYVSNGAGAEKVSEVEATKSILNGKHFTLKKSGNVISWHIKSKYDLKPHMKYRQSAMFVEYLQGLDGKAFRNFLLAVQDGEKFERVFKQELRLSIEDAWNGFVFSLQHPKSFRARLHNNV